MFSHPNTNNTPFFWEKLFSDPLFRYALRHRWETLRYGPFSTYNLTAYIDSVASLLSQAQLREFEKWDVLGKFIWRETSGYQDRDSYNREVGYLRNFLTQRWAWMDAELAKYENPYPWITDPLPTDTTGITGTSGITDSAAKVYTILLDSRLEPGIYFYRIQGSSGHYFSGRFIKLE